MRAAVLPVVLGLQELKLVFDPITGLGDCELEARLTRLVRCLRADREARTQLVSRFEMARLGGADGSSSGVSRERDEGGAKARRTQSEPLRV